MFDFTDERIEVQGNDGTCCGYMGSRWRSRNVSSGSLTWKLEFFVIMVSASQFGFLSQGRWEGTWVNLCLIDVDV